MMFTWTVCSGLTLCFLLSLSGATSDDPAFCPATQPAAACTMADREQSFIMIKPDGVQRGLVGEVIKRFEQKGFKLVAIKMQNVLGRPIYEIKAEESLLKKHYEDLATKPFFNGLIKYMTSGPVVPMVWEGLNVVKTGRQMLGETNPAQSLPGTIRGDYCITVGRNIIHGSDSVEAAKKEIALWFKPEQVTRWKSVEDPWLYE